MSITSYPRTTAQGTGNGKNIQSGYGVMLFDTATQKYVAATAATFGGVATGTATAANQVNQIGLETQIADALNGTISGNSALIDSGSQESSLQTSTGRSVLKDGSSRPVFVDAVDQSVFKTVPNDSVFKDPLIGASFLQPEVIICFMTPSSTG